MPHANYFRMIDKQWKVSDFSPRPTQIFFVTMKFLLVYRTTDDNDEDENNNYR